MADPALRQFHERWQTIGAVEAAERRAATVAQRWQQLNAVLRLALGLGLPLKEDEQEKMVWERWARLKGERT